MCNYDDNYTLNSILTIEGQYLCVMQRNCFLLYIPVNKM
jgi:hypothetical protein